MEEIKQKIESSGSEKKKKTKFERELRERTVGYILTAFGLVVGLAWNETIKSLIEYLFPMAKNTLLAKVAYALLLTVALVAATLYLKKILIKEEERGEN
jgi:hypothetical protein